MTDLPYGRGGSPLQNLIINKIYNTKISAIKVEKGLDTGDIYLQKDFDISNGNAEEILTKLSNIIFFKMIPEILDTKPKAKKQVGIPVVFKRRKPGDSKINSNKNFTIIELYDFIRMLDAEGYPKAFIELGDLKIELSKAELKNGKLSGRFEVIEDE
jgi:methionyl-tRNA formyltransferase